MTALALTDSRELQTPDPMAAFADFLRVDVADGAASENTIASYMQSVGQYYRWCQAEGIRAAMATEDNLKAYRKWLTEQYARTTAATRLAGVRRFYHMAKARGLRPDNPAEGLKVRKEATDPAERRKWLSLVEVSRVVGELRGSTPAAMRDRAIMLLFLECGPRVAEVAGLDVTDIDLDQGEVRVLGKGRKRRTLLPVGPALEALRQWLEIRETVAAAGETACFVAMPRNRLSWGTRMTTQAVRDLTDKYLSRAGVKRPGVSCHALRHTHATQALAAGATLHNLAAELGHSSTTITEVYARIVDRRRGNPAQYMADILGTAMAAG